MISICIPVYNFYVYPMIEELQQQAMLCNKKYEIIIADDKSENNFKEQNKKVQELQNVKYIELEENIGRSRIRNFLKDEASGSYILFLDCDLKIIRKDFVSKYLEFIEIQKVEEFVVCGGHTYDSQYPPPKQKLHWLWGNKCEAFSHSLRSENPYQSFMTSNFVISKKTIERIPFNEKLVGYGHEDTLLGFELLKQNIPVLHINNPVEHLGLEENKVFLHKTAESIDNLITLYDIIGRDPEFLKISKLLRSYIRLKKLRILFIYRLFFRMFNKHIEKKLMGNNPTIFALNLFKLGILAKHKIPHK